MLQDAPAFSGFSVTNLEAAHAFYGETLGLTIEDQAGMGFRLKFSNGHTVFIYEKANHHPADFTVLNFPVTNIDQVIDALTVKEVTFERYDSLPAAQDEKGVLRGLSSGYGPDIAWFKDPSGNILSLIQES